MSSPITESGSSAEDTAYATALIDQERKDAQAGLITLAIFFGLGTIGSIIIEFFVVRGRSPAAIPLGILLLLIVLSIGRRVWRIARAIFKMRQAWSAGKLADGRDALAVARSSRPA